MIELRHRQQQFYLRSLTADSKMDYQIRRISILSALFYIRKSQLMYECQTEHTSVENDLVKNKVRSLSLLAEARQLLSNCKIAVGLFCLKAGFPTTV